MEKDVKTQQAPRIKEERKRLKLTQKQTAEACSTSREQWGRYERAIQGMSTKVLAQFGKLGADTSYILTGTRTSEVEATMLDKLRTAVKEAEGADNAQGADNLNFLYKEMQQAVIRRGNNAQKRAEELRMAHYMLCDVDDEMFEKMYDAIFNIYGKCAGLIK